MPELAAYATLQLSESAPKVLRIAVREAKQAIRHGALMPLADGLAFEIEADNRCVPSAARREGIAAFNQKRQPEFTGS